MEHGRFPVPPANEKLETSGHEPESGIELYGELGLD
jgi:hypothetical protein